MRLPPLSLLLLAAACGQARAQDVAGPSPCLAAARQAEAEAGLPTGLLAAIGRVESGRWNPASSQTEAWPWTANAAGTGRYFASQPEALAGVRQAWANGYQSVDVGCFQVNLVHHPAAFATLEEAFDPLANARYAARFLSTLRAGAGSWEAAIGQYHSATPGLGEPYRQRVLANWQGGGSVTLSPAVPSVPTSTSTPAPDLRPTASFPGLQPRGTVARPDPHVLVIRNGLPAAARTGRSDPHVLNIAALLPRRGG